MTSADRRVLPLPVRRSQGSRRARLRGLLSAAVIAAVSGITPALMPTAFAQQAVAPAAPPTTAASPSDWGASVWGAARSGDTAKLEALLAAPPAGDAPELAHVRQSNARLATNLAERETLRAAAIAEARAELTKDFTDTATEVNISEALRHALELWMLTPETGRPAILAEPKINDLIARAETMARAAESRGDWLIANELFFRLDTLLDVMATYRRDFVRTSQRLAMLRLYVPERFWELRNQRQLAEKLDPLPPYNPFGDDYTKKIAPIDQDMVTRSLVRASQEHVEGTPLRTIILGGIEAVRTMISTTDLAKAFPGLGNADSVAKMNAFLDSEAAAFKNGPERPELASLDSLLRRLTMYGRLTLELPDRAVLHEFGNGAMGTLDEFSSIIWPDEKARFDRLTSGKFVGVGISIEYDELQNIRVVTPLDGTPAQRAGVRAGDIIKKVDGRSIYGFTLDQAVEVITGPPRTQVTLTMEREMPALETTATAPAPPADPAKPAAEAPEVRKMMIDFPITRDVIETKSVRGWKRSGTHEDDWDWFIDKDAGIGYIRLSQFADDSVTEIDRAVAQMRPQGLTGLILDLRFNPGGLLNQAVDITNRFVDGGVVVKTKAPGQDVERVERATGGRATLKGLPVIILVNESSASASEIVAGAVQAYARTNALNAIVMGQRSFGKGSVQNVYSLARGQAALKLTTQYYYLPDDRLIHRKPGATAWGIEPDLKIEMLPKQQTDTIVLRRNADVVALDENGKAIPAEGKEANPDDLMTKSLDLQLQTAVAVLQAQALRASNTAMKTATPEPTKTP